MLLYAESLGKEILNHQIKIQELDSLVNTAWYRANLHRQANEVIYRDSLGNLIAKDILSKKDSLVARLFYDNTISEFVIAKDEFDQDQNGEWVKKRSYFDQNRIKFMEEAFYEGTGLIFYKSYKVDEKFVEVGAGAFYSPFPWVFPVFYR